MVVRDPVNTYMGALTVTVTKTEQVLLEEKVVLSYEARFGPDVADVQDWQNQAITVIDEYIAAQGETT